MLVKATMSLVKDSDQKPIFAVEMVEDITAQKSTQEKMQMFETAVFASAEAVVITDPNLPDNPVVYINPAFEELTGYQAGQIIGRNCRFLNLKDRKQPALKKVRYAIKHGEKCQVTLRNYRKDGTLFYNKLSIYPLHNAEGKLVHFVGVQREVPKPKSEVDQA